MRRRIRAFVSKGPSWVTVLVLIVAVSAPAYLRQEQIINDAKEAAEVALAAQMAANETREIGRLLACESDRTFALGHNQLVTHQQEFLVTLATSNREPRTPEEQARVDRIIQGEMDRFAKSFVPVRECTPEAIREFYEDPPVTTPPTTEPVPFQGDTG